MRNSEQTLERHKERTEERELKPVEDLMCYLREYSRQRPESIAIACFGLGFILGWKLKLW